LNERPVHLQDRRNQGNKLLGNVGPSVHGITSQNMEVIIVKADRANNAFTVMD
jgi:hypothetical protein